MSRCAGFDFEALVAPPSRVVCVLRDHMGTALCEPAVCTTEQLSDETWMPRLGPCDRDAPYCEITMTYANGDVYHITIRGGLRRGEMI